MINFRDWYIVVRKHVPHCTQMDLYDIPGRIYSADTVRIDTYHRNESLSPTVLEYDGEFFWRVALSRNLAPDGIKRIAYVLGGVSRYEIRTKLTNENMARVANAVINSQYRFYVHPFALRTR